jgi:hypothetical protein
MYLIRWIYLIKSHNNLCFVIKKKKKKINIVMLMLFICLKLLSVFVCCNCSLSVFGLFLCLLTTAVSFNACVVTQWFCPVCIKHQSHTLLGISLFHSKHLYNYNFTLCITLDMFCILLLIVLTCGFMECK